ncbi:MAG TPA: hypothetical protein VKC34_04765 [Blastocatellia bacterium]|nr:hypothetical protein [Blastocatellia bacterium]
MNKHGVSVAIAILIVSCVGVTGGTAQNANPVTESQALWQYDTHG